MTYYLTRERVPQPKCEVCGKVATERLTCHENAPDGKVISQRLLCRPCLDTAWDANSKLSRRMSEEGHP